MPRGSAPAHPRAKTSSEASHHCLSIRKRKSVAPPFQQQVLRQMLLPGLHPNHHEALVNCFALDITLWFKPSF
eukprot:1194602-Amphidinium_carterae.1